MPVPAKTEFRLRFHDSGRATRDERHEHIKEAEGVVLLLMEAAAPMVVLALIVLSMLAALCR
jgi:hypothetical protein